MSRPGGATIPQGGSWPRDGAMSEAVYVDNFAVSDAERASERAELDSDGFVSAAYVHWQGAPEVVTEVVTEVTAAGFGSTAGASDWLKVDDGSFADDTQLRSSPPVPGVSLFAIETPTDRLYTYAGFARFGKIVMEVYVFSHQQDDPVAENELASAAATQSGILQRLSS